MYQLIWSDLLSTFGYSQIHPLLSLWLLEQGFSLPAIALGSSLLLATSFICSLPAGLLADRLGNRTALLAAGGLQGVAAWGQIAATTPRALYLANVWGGLALALFSSAKLPLLGQSVPAAGLATAVAKARAAASLGSVLGGATAAWICWRYSDMRYALLLGASTVSLALLPLLWLPRSSKRPSSGAGSPGRRLRGNWQRILSVCFLAAIGYSLITPYASLLLDQRGFSAGSISASFSLWQLLAVVAWPLTRCLSRAGRSLPATLLTLASLTLLLAPRSPNHYWWGLWLLWQIALYTVQCLLQTAIALSTQRAVPFASLSMLQTVAVIVGLQAGSRLLTHPGWLYPLAAGCFVLATVILMASASRMRTDSGESE
ncbi:MAG: MFS transporter [Bacillota bacterium]|jgi:predicted MFS family arabinose efflux permease